jgi:hypothetical protein
MAGLMIDANENLFGTTPEGGAAFTGGSSGDGTVFETADRAAQKNFQTPSILFYSASLW